MRAFFIALHQKALETFFPKRALAPHAAVVPLREALLEFLHEDRDVAHAALVAGEDFRLPNAAAGGGGAVEFFANALHGEAVVEEAEAAKEGVAIQGRQLVPVGLLNEKMEVIGHQRVGDDTESEEGLELAHEGDSELPFLVAEDKAPVDDAGEAMVVAEAFAPDACLSHGVSQLHR